MNAEGWYLDPYEVHGERWFSDGKPTALVRDGGQESHDDPPPGPVPGPLVEPPERQTHGDDLKRAGEFEKPEPTIFGYDELVPGNE